MPLDEFTARRNALAKQLAEEGDRERADELKRLRKPRLPAWAVNQLARRVPDSVDRLLAAGDRVQGAESAEALRRATQERHAVVQELVKRAEGILADGGQSTNAATLHEVSQTLYAATSAEERDRLKRGVLTEPLEGAGFEQALGLPQRDVAAEERLEPRRKRASEELRRFQEEFRQAQDEAKRLRGEAERARRAARVAEQELEAADVRVRRLEDRVAQAREKLDSSS